MFSLRKNLIREYKLYFFIIFLMIIAGFLLFAYPLFFTPERPDVCIFHRIIGIACPGCGTGRGIISLFHLKLKEAFFYNPFSIPVFIIIIIAPFWILFDFITKKTTLYVFIKKNDLFFLKNKLLLILLFLLFIANWIWNIYKY